MTTTASTAIQTGLGEGDFGIFESGPMQLQTLNDRDIYELILDEPATSSVDAPGTVIVFTEALSAFTASGFALNIDATNRTFGVGGNLIAAASGAPLFTVAPVDASVDSSIFLGISTASSPEFLLHYTTPDLGANIIFNYRTSIAYLKSDLDIDGDNVVRGSEYEPLILGDNIANTLIGSAGFDVIVGFGGDDIIQGGNGNDEIEGGSGNDTLNGQVGDDSIRGGAGNDLIFGGVGDDEMQGGAGNDTLRGGVGIDDIVGGGGNDLLSGEQGDDALSGGDGNDTINGGLGDDDLTGGDGDDLLRGLEDDDVLNGGNGNDDLRGNDNDDTLNGGDGDDILRGQGDDDMLNGDAGNDTAFGGLGDDLIFGDKGNDCLRGGAGDDDLNGGNGDDFLSGEIDDDTLNGGNGDDTLVGGLGSDNLNGYGDGADSAERDILVGAIDGTRDRFVLAQTGIGGTFYTRGGDADFAVLRHVEIDIVGTTSGVEDRILLNATDTYFLADISLVVPSIGGVTGVGIYLNNNNSVQTNDLVAVIENVFEANIAEGMSNDLFMRI